MCSTSSARRGGFAAGWATFMIGLAEPPRGAMLRLTMKSWYSDIEEVCVATSVNLEPNTQRGDCCVTPW